MAEETTVLIVPADGEDTIDVVTATVTVVGTVPIGPPGPQGDPGADGSPGVAGDDGREVELQKSATHVQWRYVGDPGWTNLVALSDITGPQGIQGIQGVQGNAGSAGAAGDDGREVQLQNNGTHIQWRYEGEVSWTNLVALSAITGPAGSDGADGADGAPGDTHVPDPSGEPDDRWLKTAGGALVYSDAPSGGGGAVDSVNGETGVVVLTAGDIGSTPAGALAATDVQAALVELDTEKAPLASPALTGTPTAPTAAGGTNTTQVATTAFVAAAVAALIDGAPGAIDTLNELAAALGDDPDFAATVTNALAGKQPLDSDLTAIAALTTTAFGRSLLEAANAGALRTLAGLGTAAVLDAGTGAGNLITKATADGAYVPLAGTWRQIDEDTVLVTSGNIDLNQTNITDLTAFDMTLSGAQAGDVVKVHCDMALTATAHFVGFDWYTMVSGSPVNPFGPGLSASLATTSGLRGWFVPNQSFAFPLSCSARRTLVSGDISGGNVSIRLRYAKTTLNSRVLLANASDPARVWAELWRPPS